MKLAIVGSRNMTDTKLFREGIIQVLEKYGEPVEVISGGAPGADSLGAEWARQNNYPLIEYKPNWSKYGKQAGILRNGDIVNQK